MKWGIYLKVPRAQIILQWHSPRIVFHLELLDVAATTDALQEEPCPEVHEYVENKNRLHSKLKPVHCGVADWIIHEAELGVGGGVEEVKTWWRNKWQIRWRRVLVIFI